MINLPRIVRGRFAFGSAVRPPIFLVLPALVSSVGAQEERTPLVALELPTAALAQHLGLRSWSFVYNAPPGERTEVRIFHYERAQNGEWQNRYLASFSERSDPSGQQRITFVIGPAGLSLPYSLGINAVVFGGTLDEVDLDGFNTFAVDQPGTVLFPTDETEKFILMAHYAEQGGNVTATGNPADMDAYLALEVTRSAR